MKRLYKYTWVLVTASVFLSCGKSFLDRSLQGEVADDQLETTKAVEWTLIGAYALLNGNRDGTWGNYGAAPSQWLFGEVAADNAHKGSQNSDQATMNDIELHSPNSINEHLSTLWNNYYEGIARCNTTLRLLKNLQESGTQKFSDERAAEIEAEARMLRAHYYFYLKRVFVNLPYVDETISTQDAIKLPNNTDVYPQIEADLQFAVDTLGTSKPLGEVGRVDQIAAKAYLGKVFLYEKKYPEALVLFKDVIAARPNLVSLPFQNNFDINTENGPEAIFSVQHAINPDGGGDNGNVGDMLSGLYGTAPVICCGFYQPSVDLVNAYKVDAQGLPYLDNSYRTDPYKSDFGLSGSAKTDYQVNRALRVDPRLDYTVGRRGVPYLDWGIMQGDAWIRDPAYAGPFVSIKTMINQADFSGNTAAGTLQLTGLNVNIIRLSDVYLMAAECAVETNDLEYARLRVNDVRNRAATLPAKMVGGTAVATYMVRPYASFPSQDYARNAVRFERRLELALEGQRFFDLNRWGIAKTVIESYWNFERSILVGFPAVTYEEKDSYFPIPQDQIDRSGGALVQNEGY